MKFKTVSIFAILLIIPAICFSSSIYLTSVGTVVDSSNTFGDSYTSSSNFQIIGTASDTSRYGGTFTIPVTGDSLESIYNNWQPASVFYFLDTDGTPYITLFSDFTLTQQSDGTYSGTATASNYPISYVDSPATWGDVSLSAFTSIFNTSVSGAVSDNLFSVFDLSKSESLTVSVLILGVLIVLGFIGYRLIIRTTSKV